MAQYLGRGMRMIVAGLAPERIVVVGDLTHSWQRFGPVIEAEIKAQVLAGGHAPLVIPPSKTAWRACAAPSRWFCRSTSACDFWVAGSPGCRNGAARHLRG